MKPPCDSNCAHRTESAALRRRQEGRWWWVGRRAGESPLLMLQCSERIRKQGLQGRVGMRKGCWALRREEKWWNRHVGSRRQHDCQEAFKTHLRYMVTYLKRHQSTCFTLASISKTQDHGIWSHGKQMEKQWKQWQTLFSWAPKSLQMVIAAMKLKDTFSLEEKLWPT